MNKNKQNEIKEDDSTIRVILVENGRVARDEENGKYSL